MDPKPLSTRTCFLLVLLFGVATYANTFTGVFQFDDIPAILENRYLYPFDLGKLWGYYPLRFITHLSFVFNIYFAGFQTWSFHVLNLLIHISASWVTFQLTRSILRTPAMKDRVPPEQQDLFALIAALLFVAHPIQTQAVTYIVQRATSLATLFYLATLWTYLKARLENIRFYWHTFLLMLAAMLTKEISFTLPFAILLTELCFFPVSEQDPLRKKIIRWIPFALFLLVIPLLHMGTPPSLTREIGSIKIFPTVSEELFSRLNYLLTQFRVERTYLRLLFLPVGQRLLYDYRLSTSLADTDSWAAFSLLLSVLLLAFICFKKNKLLSFGIFWFFLTLSVESLLIPLYDVIFEHRLYLPMFGFVIFLTSLLWTLTRSVKAFVAVSLAIILVLTGMTYARNEVWRTVLSLFQDAAKKSPRNGNIFAGLGDAYQREVHDLKTAAVYYEKALRSGYVTRFVLINLINVHSRLGDPEKSQHFEKMLLSIPDPFKGLPINTDIQLAPGEESRGPKAVETLQKAIAMNPESPWSYIHLGKVYQEMRRENDAVLAFQKAIEVAPLDPGGYEALAYFYSQKNDEQKALAVMKDYLKFKKKHRPWFGS